MECGSQLRSGFVRLVLCSEGVMDSFIVIMDQTTPPSPHPQDTLTVDHPSQCSLSMVQRLRSIFSLPSSSSAQSSLASSLPPTTLDKPRHSFCSLPSAPCGPTGYRPSRPTSQLASQSHRSSHRPRRRLRLRRLHRPGSRWTPLPSHHCPKARAKRSTNASRPSSSIIASPSISCSAPTPVS